MLNWIKNFVRVFARVANPNDKTGYYTLPHVVVLLALTVAFFVGVAIGAIGGSVRYNGAFFAQKYACTENRCLPVPLTTKTVNFTSHEGVGVAYSSIQVSRYPAVGDQDGQGACAAWGTAWDLSYLWRMTHPKSYLRFSPRQMYSHFSDAYNGGQDGGSWPDQDAEISNTVGLLQFKMMPSPPYALDNPELPLYDAYGNLSTTDAAKHRFLVTFNKLQSYSMGGGPDLITAINVQLDQGNPVLVGFPVYPEYDNATQQPNIVPPGPGEQSRGAHLNVILARDDNRLMPDGTFGAYLVQNQWTIRWGIQGRAWISYSFAQSYFFGAQVAHISPATTSPNPPFPPPGAVQAQTLQASWYVGKIYAADRPGYRLDKLFNYWGDHYKIRPAGLASTFGAECNFRTGVGGNCNRVVFPYDISGGGCQVTVSTAVTLGIGDGSASAYNIARVFAWEDNPANCVWAEATLMHRFQVYRAAHYPQLNILWNCGQYTTQYPYPYPGTGCYSNYYQGFLPWWERVNREHRARHPQA